MGIVSGCSQPETHHKTPVHASSILGQCGISVDPPGSMCIRYMLSRYDRNRNRYIDVERGVTVDPRRSALVVIDAWDRDYLDSMIVNFINPLIKELSELGVKVIYAPSQNQQSDRLLVTRESVTLTHSEIMDDYLMYHEIENLFYVGYDTYHCLSDKPNGIFSYRLRNGDRAHRVFVFEKGVASQTREMKEVAISLLKKHDVGVIMSECDVFTEIFPETTKVDVFATTVCQIDSGNNFVLIFKKDELDEDLSQFEQYLRENGVDFGVVQNGELIYKDRTIIDIYKLMQLLKWLEVRNIFYCGYHLNREILWSEFGVTPLYIKKRYFGIAELPVTYIINDLSYLIPSCSIDPMIEKAVVINHYRDIKNILSTTLVIGLRSKSAVPPPFRDTSAVGQYWPFLVAEGPN